MSYPGYPGGGGGAGQGYPGGGGGNHGGGYPGAGGGGGYPSGGGGYPSGGGGGYPDGGGGGGYPGGGGGGGGYPSGGGGGGYAGGGGGGGYPGATGGGYPGGGGGGGYPGAHGGGGPPPPPPQQGYGGFQPPHGQQAPPGAMYGQDQRGHGGYGGPPPHGGPPHGGPPHGGPPPGGPSFAQPQSTGRKKALLIGINYTGTQGALQGCQADVRKMFGLIQRFGWSPDPSSTLVLTDDQQDRFRLPTRENILTSMSWLVGGAQPGDVLFFHFSGHGSQVPDETGDEEDGFDETIVPLDYFTHKVKQITDDEIFARMIEHLPSGVKLTAVMDCCHSGTGMDLPFMWNEQRSQWDMDPCPGHSRGDVILFSGCDDNQTSADVGQAGGAMTCAFTEVMSTNPHCNYLELIGRMRAVLRQRGFKQIPQMSSTQPFDTRENFSLFTIHPDSGRFPPGRTRPNPSQKKNKHKLQGKHKNNALPPFLQQLGFGGQGGQKMGGGVVGAVLGSLF